MHVTDDYHNKKGPYSDLLRRKKKILLNLIRVCAFNDPCNPLSSKNFFF